jgi:hypothetical protein
MFLYKALENVLKTDASIPLLVLRRLNLKAQLDDLVQWVCGSLRKQVETTFRQLAERILCSIHALTARGFELKVFRVVSFPGLYIGMGTACG